MSVETHTAHARALVERTVHSKRCQPKYLRLRYGSNLSRDSEIAPTEVTLVCRVQSSEWIASAIEILCAPAFENVRGATGNNTETRKNYLDICFSNKLLFQPSHADFNLFADGNTDSFHQGMIGQCVNVLVRTFPSGNHVVRH